MLTAATLGQYTGEEGALDLLRTLGYPIAPIDVDSQEWRRGGVSIPWNGEARLRLISRLRRFDLFLLHGSVREEWIAEFMRSYRDYNVITKSAIIYCADESISVFDLSPERALRRLDVDLAHPTTHAVDRLNLLARGDDDALPRIFDRALDREQVTREFFQRFRAAVRDVAEALAKEFPSEERTAIDGEALLILSRLLFLSFVQEKGWLGGERRFLVDRLEHEIKRGREFFSGVLLPLFFGCLNTPLHERSLAARKLGRVPYLNGGLFEPSSFEQRHPEMHLSNVLMQRVMEEVFEKFDFRIDETDAAGTHIDPEMLGRVFESLMASDERAASGSFYTPKEIVDLLTERAITEWLGDGGLEKLERITILDPACGSGAFLLSALGVIERLWRARTSDVPRDLRRRIIANSLYGVDLKPEAVRLCELRLWLAIVSGSDAGVDDVEPLPNLDRNILQGNSLLSPTDFLGDGRMDIYLDWLTAVHAQRDLLERYRTASFTQRSALYRIIRGNDQRLASELLARTIDVSEAELRHASAPQKDLFGRSAPLDGERCRELQQRIAEAKAMLDRVEQGTLDFFSFDVHFAPVMANGGFDVVVGNPPWVRNARIDARAKKMLTDRYALFRPQHDGAAFHQPDLSVAFFERAMQLSAPEGVVALLMPAKILNAAYAAPLRRAAEGRVIAIDDWSDDPRRRKWFEADTFPLGIVLQGGRASSPLSPDILSGDDPGGRASSPPPPDILSGGDRAENRAHGTRDGAAQDARRGRAGSPAPLDILSGGDRAENRAHGTRDGAAQDARRGRAGSPAPLDILSGGDRAESRAHGTRDGVAQDARRGRAGSPAPLDILSGDDRAENRAHGTRDGAAQDARRGRAGSPPSEEVLTVIGSDWALLPPDVAAILRRLRTQHPTLAEALHRRPFMGVKTGDNRNFFLDPKTIRELRIPLSAICRCVRGRDLQRWSVGEAQWMLWPPRQGWRKPPKWLEKLASARGMRPMDFRLSFVRPEHVGIKVAWKDLSRGVAAAVLPDVVHVREQPVPLIPNQTLYAIDAASLDEAYAIAAILNSTIAGALLVSVAERAKDAHFRYFGRTVAALPWPDTSAESERLVRLSRRAHRGADVMNELDLTVARLYDVTPGELATLRAYLERRLDARRASD